MKTIFAFLSLVACAIAQTPVTFRNPLIIGGTASPTFVIGSGTGKAVLSAGSGSLLVNGIALGTGGGSVTVGGTNGQIQYNNGGVLGGLNSSGTGDVVRATGTAAVASLLFPVPTWNQSTTGTAAVASLLSPVPTWNQSTTGSAGSVPIGGVIGIGAGGTAALSLPADSTGGFITSGTANFVSVGGLTATNNISTSASVLATNGMSVGGSGVASDYIAYGTAGTNFVSMGWHEDENAGRLEISSGTISRILQIPSGGTSGIISLPITGSGTLLLSSAITGTVGAITNGTATNLTISGGTASSLTLASGSTSLVGVVRGGTGASVVLGNSTSAYRNTTTGGLIVANAPGTATNSVSIGAGNIAMTGELMWDAATDQYLTAGQIYYNSTFAIIGNPINFGSSALSSAVAFSVNNSSAGSSAGAAYLTASSSGGTAGVMTATGTAANVNAAIMAKGTGGYVTTGTSGLLITALMSATGTPSAGWVLALGTDGSLQARGTAGIIKTIAP